MSLALLASAGLLVGAIGSETARVEESRGFLGWGVGFEAPRVGLSTGYGERSSLGWGYDVGAGITYRLSSRWQLHARLLAGQAFGGTARVRFLDGGSEVGVDESADWLGLETTAGLTYHLRRGGRAWVPYLGVEGGWGYGGFDFRLSDEVAAKLDPPAGAQEEEQFCSVLRCTLSSHTAAGGFALVGVRGGVRFVLTEWLTTELELTATLTRLGREPLAGTTAARAAHSVEQTVLLLRPTFVVRLGL